MGPGGEFSCDCGGEGMGFPIPRSQLRALLRVADVVLME